MDKMLYGAAYYLEYMPADHVDEDMKLIKDAGLNVIRIAESTWSTLEPSDGVFDFSCIDRVLEAAGRHGLSVIIGTPTYAVPSWLAKRHPGIMLKTAEGKERYGHRQLSDITSPEYLQYSERVIRRLAEHTASHPSVIGFQIDNETKHFGMASKRVQKKFVDYLKERFVTTEALNKAFYLSYWSNSISDWEDFPDMRGCVNGGLACEFEKFRRKLAADFLAWQASLISEYKREDQFITHNLDFEWKPFGDVKASNGYSYGVQPGINHYDASKCLTIAGTDIYHPTEDQSTGAEIAFGGDSIRSLKNAPYLVLETQAQGFKYWTPYPGQLMLDVMSHLGSGAGGVMYWHWHSVHNGFETYWKGILSHDLRPGRVYQEIAGIGNKIAGIGSERLMIEKKNRIALVVDNHSLSAMQYFATDPDFSYNDTVRWMYDALYQLNLECDVTDVNNLEPEKYQMIVIPTLYSAEEHTISALKRFVENGGTLVASFRSFFTDEFLSVYPDLQPHGMTECFGMHYSEFAAPGTACAGGKPVRYFMELLETDGAETVLSYEHPYWSRYAAVTRHSYGKGTAWYIGACLDQEVLKGLFLDAAAGAGIDGPAFGTVWPVAERCGVTKAGKKLHYLLNYSASPKKVTCPKGAFRDLLSDTLYQEGDEILLADWGAAVLEEA